MSNLTFKNYIGNMSTTVNRGRVKLGHNVSVARYIDHENDGYVLVLESNGKSFGKIAMNSEEWENFAWAASNESNAQFYVRALELFGCNSIFNPATDY